EKGLLEKVEVERITINPELSLIELLSVMNESKKRKEIEILKIGFEGSLQTTNFTEMGFGKGKKVTIKQTGTGMSIPRKVLKITHSYTIEDLIDAFNELEDYLISHKHDYTLDIYPVKLSLVDRGTAPNYAQHIVVFEKRRKVDKNSEVGSMLKGAQYMPLDAVKLFKTKYNGKKNKYEKTGIPSVITEKMKHYDSKSQFIDADNIKNYTRNLYESEFTIRTNCIVGKETKVFAKFTTIPGGTCKIVPK
ncbi:MAG: hypothetical protein ACFFG0_17690, partial [Candidatus Thorarchaeota archaeon]